MFLGSFIFAQIRILEVSRCVSTPLYLHWRPQNKNSTRTDAKLPMKYNWLSKWTSLCLCMYLHPCVMGIRVWKFPSLLLSALENSWASSGEYYPSMLADSMWDGQQKHNIQYQNKKKNTTTPLYIVNAQLPCMNTILQPVSRNYQG